jgi:hypothetical protein
LTVNNKILLSRTSFRNTEHNFAFQNGFIQVRTILVKQRDLSQETEQFDLNENVSFDKTISKQFS